MGKSVISIFPAIINAIILSQLRFYSRGLDAPRKEVYMSYCPLPN